MSLNDFKMASLKDKIDDVETKKQELEKENTTEIEGEVKIKRTRRLSK